MATSMINAMCRCCASEGVFKDVKSTYHWMGDEEIYADMLKECFDVSLFIPEEGAEGGEGGICEVCITQLRNAVNFKKQVLHTEEQFKRHVQNKLFKPNIVKVEVEPDDDNDSDDNNASAEEGYSGAEYEIPIKKEVPEEPKPKKRAAAVKASTSRAKKAKTEIGEPSTKRVQRIVTIEIENADTKESLKIHTDALNKPIMTKEVNERLKTTELNKHRSNVQLILQCTNATPIRCRGGIGYACSFCSNEYPEPADLKKHTLEEHDDKAKLKFMNDATMHAYLVKLDITDLTCKICDSKIDTLEQLTDHLIKIHDKKLFTDIKNHIMLFKFDDDVLKCIHCGNIFNRFKILQQHMNIHNRNYICKICDAGFINKGILRSHSKVHETGTFKCDSCPKVFNTYGKKKSHEKSVHVHASLLSKCGYCKLKFSTYIQKDKHLAKVHGVHMKRIKCYACDKTFPHQRLLRLHTERDHLMERKHKCTLCDMQFFQSTDLNLHMVKHTGAREFKCDVCSKSYGRKKTLREHMRIHNDDRRFTCEHCGQAFVQKCSWRGHMKNRHQELV